MPLTVCPRCSCFVSDSASFCLTCGLPLHDPEYSQISPEPSRDLGATPPSSPPSTPGFVRRHHAALAVVVILIAAVIRLGLAHRHRIQTALNPPVAVLSVSPARDALPSSGGTVVVSARVGYATQCAVSLLREE